MSARPRITLCIPTYNRAVYLKGAVESALREAASHPSGVVEVLVCDNASPDGTPELLASLQEAHPQLRALRNSENLGFDRNYLRCVEEARGEFVWVMGDDDVWMPGSIARVFRELDAGADACLCLAEACDLDLNPCLVLPWFRSPNPPTVWHLEGGKDLIPYFEGCVRNAGVFAFISVGIFRRDRFLLKRENFQGAADTGYAHLLGMMHFFRKPLSLHYIPEVLIRNRLSDAVGEAWTRGSLYGRLMHDLRGWTMVADAVFGDDAEIHDAFSRIVGRNHHNTMLPGLRRDAVTEAAWLDSRPYLLRAGFSPVQIATVDFAFHLMGSDRFPMPTLDPATLCLVDLPLLVRGAQRIAVLALGGLPNILDGAGLLATLSRHGGAGRIRIFCPSKCAELLDIFEIQPVDPKRYAADLDYRSSIVRCMTSYGPELAVNLDPERGVEGDDLVHAALPAGAIAFEYPEHHMDAALIESANGVYTRLTPRAAGADAMIEALGLKGDPPTLWPSPTAQEEARTVLEQFGWDPAETLAVLVDGVSEEGALALQAVIAEAAEGGRNLVGMGDGRGSYRFMETLLSPWEDRAVNLVGSLSLGSMVALLKLCGNIIGGDPFSQSLARACGSAPLASNPSKGSDAPGGPLLQA